MIGTSLILAYSVALVDPKNQTVFLVRELDCVTDDSVSRPAVNTTDNFSSPPESWSGGDPSWSAWAQQSLYWLQGEIESSNLNEQSTSINESNKLIRIIELKCSREVFIIAFYL